MIKHIESKEAQSRDAKLGWWDTWGDGEYCLLRAAHIAYEDAADLLSATHPYAPVQIRAERARMVEAHWSAFAQLANILNKQDWLAKHRSK